MYAVGANNPIVGTDRRQQLLQLLAQQANDRNAVQQAQGSAFGLGQQNTLQHSLGNAFVNARQRADNHGAAPDVVGPNGLGFEGVQQLIAQRRQRAMATPSSAPSQAAGALRNTAGTQLLSGNLLPAGVAGHINTASGGVSTPVPQNPVPAARSVTAPTAGTPIGVSPGVSPMPGAVGPAAGVAGASPMGQLMQRSTGGLPSGPSIGDPAAGSAGGPTLVPLGNGVYYTPATGGVSGLPAPTLASTRINTPGRQL